MMLMKNRLFLLAFCALSTFIQAQDQVNPDNLKRLNKTDMHSLFNIERRYITDCQFYMTELRS